jgi:hypothetical protein
MSLIKMTNLNLIYKKNFFYKKFFLFLCFMFLFISFTFCISKDEKDLKNNYSKNISINKDSNIDFYFEKANKFYEKSDYNNALNLYLNLYSQGWISKDLLYNISNTYYKLGQKGYSLVFIERAKILAPRDSDINYNRKFIYNLVGEKEEPFKEVVNILNLNELIISFLIFNILFWILCILINDIRLNFFKNKFIYIRFFVLFVVIFFAIWLVTFSIINHKKILISIIPDVPVFASPTQDGLAIFTVPEAKKVSILNRKGDWQEIYLEDENLKGWAKKENFEVV